MLKDEIKTRMIAAMKAKQPVVKNILRVALGEIQTAEARAGADVADADVEKILRKLIKSIGESRAAAEGEAKATLGQEIEVLEQLLPQMLTPDEIASALVPVREAILAAGNDGQATGVAMKHLKSIDAPVDGKAVSQAVRSMRA